MKEKIGFIGLGIMGKPMAKNLIKSGYSLIVYDIIPEAIKDVVKEGAERGMSPKDMASKSDIIITMLPNSPEVEDVLVCDDGIIEGIKPGAIYIDMSSIDPLITKRLSEKILKKGAVMLDAPVSGGEPKAIDATLSIMVGGPSQAFYKVEHILRVMGSSVVLVGSIGSGNVTKLANQIIVALNIAAMSEAMVFATKTGVDPEKVYNAIRGGLAGSTVLDAKVSMILKRNFNPGFRLELHMKDLANALNTAHEVGAPLPLSAQVFEIMQALKVDGKAKNDHSAIIQFYEKLANIEVKKI